MGILSYMFGVEGMGSKWYPEKNKLYKFYSGFSSPYEDLNAEDKIKIKPYVIIDKKTIRARFIVKEDYCLISLSDKKKIKVPINKCVFRQNYQKYYQGQSIVDAYSLYIIVR